MIRTLLTGCLAIFHLFAVAQEAISFSYDYGNIAIHSPSIKPLVTGPVQGFSINYAFANNKGTLWRGYYNYPDYGINYDYKDYSNPEHLGNSHAVTGFLQLPFIRIGNFLSLGFKGLTGVGLFTNKYDPLNNSLNKAISTTLNINTETRLYSKINLHPVFLEYSYGLDHFSNGLMNSPNLGINVFNSKFSMGYYFEEQVSPKKMRTPQAERTEKYEFWGVSSMGIKQIDSDPKRYLFSGLTVNFALFLSQVSKLGIGVDLHKDPSLVLMSSNNPLQPADTGFSVRYGINLNHEFMMGRTGFFAGYGYYMRDAGYNPSKRYFKAGFKYYYNRFIGMALVRAVPLFRADVVEFGFGYRLTKYKNQETGRILTAGSQPAGAISARSSR